MTTVAQHAYALLKSIEVALARGATVRLNDEEHAYLLDVCRAALSGASDPLRVGKAAGGQQRSDDGLGEAMLVHHRRHELGTLTAAYRAVAADLNRDPRTADKGGAVEKNYAKHRAALEAADRLYGARRTGHELDAADITAILNPMGK
jgi:hypothetical protein